MVTQNSQVKKILGAKIEIKEEPLKQTTNNILDREFIWVLENSYGLSPKLGLMKLFTSFSFIILAIPGGCFFIKLKYRFVRKHIYPEYF